MYHETIRRSVCKERLVKISLPRIGVQHLQSFFLMERVGECEL